MSAPAIYSVSTEKRDDRYDPNTAAVAGGRRGKDDRIQKMDFIDKIGIFTSTDP
jgi:hypothetical protein